MATKLNAFLAAVPANCPSPVQQHKPPPISFPHTDLLLQTPSPSFSDNRKLPQPSTPQPQQRRRNNNAHRQQQFQRHNAASLQKYALATTELSNQTEQEPKTPFRQQMYQKEKDSEVEGGEAGPMRRINAAQGAHHRRVSTDTTLFHRYLRNQAHRDINHDVVQHFLTVPVVTVSRRCDYDTKIDQLDNNEGYRGSSIDPQEILRVFRRGETLSVATALEIIKQSTNLMALDQNVIVLRAPYTLVGDLHGQFQDLLEIFRVHGDPSPSNPFLFLGDYVDRGVASCEIILLLLAFKVAFPSSVHLLRGNHECRSLSTFYGFRAECLKKYGTLVYNRVVKCFETMPLAAKLETSYGTFLAVHGGLSPEIQRVDDINNHVNRFMEPEPNGALCDLLWSDPSKDPQQENDWVHNAVRGCSFTFNEQICREFLKENGLLAIIRAHELEEDGFREHFHHPNGHQNGDSRTDTIENLVQQLPPIVTVFSAPEYCNTNSNMGATLVVPWQMRPQRLLEYQQHKRSKHSEHEYERASEDEAMKAFLKEQLPFLPVDFYDLVALCRQVRISLAQSSSHSSVSLVSSSQLVPTEEQSNGTKKAAYTLDVSHEDRDDATEDNTRSIRQSTTEEASQADVRVMSSAGPGIQPLEFVTPKVICGVTTTIDSAATPTSSSRRMKRPSSRRSLGGWRFCTGFIHFYERYFGSLPCSSRNRSHQASTVGAIGASIAPRTSSSLLSIYGRQKDKRSSLSAEPMNKSSDSSTVDSNESPVNQCSRQEQSDSIVSPRAQTHHNIISTESNGTKIFTNAQWEALKLYFTLLDVSGNGVLMEESFVLLLAEQDSDAYATEDELALLMEVIDFNADGLITEQDFLLFAYRALLQHNKNTKTTTSTSA